MMGKQWVLVANLAFDCVDLLHGNVHYGMRPHGGGRCAIQH